jgi:hypothetical protein
MRREINVSSADSKIFCSYQVMTQQSGDSRNAFTFCACALYGFTSLSGAPA